MDQNRMPLVEALQQFREEAPAYFRIPGHRFERGLDEALNGASLAAYDLSEAEGLDDLHHAEGVIAELVNHSPYNIEEAKIIVTGYGCCGRAVAARLKALGARVTVLARRREVRKLAKKDGFYAADFAFGPEEAMGAAMVVNTVPALVVTEKIIRELPRDAYIVDIASGEGGTDFACAREYGIHADHVLGIPGKYAPKESAYILERSVERFILKEKQGEMSDGF